MENNKLKGLLKEKQKTYFECSSALGISKTSFAKKINGISKFTVPEAAELKNFLGISTSRWVDIFLN